MYLPASNAVLLGLEFFSTYMCMNYAGRLLEYGGNKCLKEVKQHRYSCE